MTGMHQAREKMDEASKASWKRWARGRQRNCALRALADDTGRMIEVNISDMEKQSIRSARMEFKKRGFTAGIGGRDAKNGHLFKAYQSLSLIVLLLVLSGIPADGQNQVSARKVIYQMYERHMAILGEITAAGTVDEVKSKEIRNELAKINTSPFTGEEKKDLDEWRKSLVALLDKQPKSVSESGFRSWEPLRKCMAVLADHDITGALADSDGYPQLAEKIDALHDMAKGILLVRLRLDTKALQEVSPITRAFVEYFYILTVLTGPENRDPIARSALLSMRPGEIKEESLRQVFLGLHKALLPLLHGAQGKSEKAFDKGKLPMVFLCDLLKKGQIENAEIKKAGADENVLALVEKLHELGKADKCGSIAPR